MRAGIAICTQAKLFLLVEVRGERAGLGSSKHRLGELAILSNTTGKDPLDVYRYRAAPQSFRLETKHAA